MSDEDEPSTPDHATPESSPELAGASGTDSRRHHKVIADIHSGMVLVAPVATQLLDEDQADEDLEPRPAIIKPTLN